MVKNFEIRKYNIRLTQGVLKAPFNQRTKRANIIIKKFVVKNTRADKDKIFLGNELNNFLWKNGAKNPPTKVSVFIQNLKDGRVFVNLEGAPLKIEKKKEEKKEEKGKDNLEELTDEFKTNKEEKTEIKKEEPKTQKTPAKPKKK